MKGLKYPKYFFQEEAWAGFWKESNGQNHSYFLVNTTSENLSALVYVYPWFLGESFAYAINIPSYNHKIASISKETLIEEFKELIELILKESKEKGVAFVKFNLEDQFLNFVGYQSLEFAECLKLVEQSRSGYRFVYPSKRIQYLGTMTLDLEFAFVAKNSVVKENTYEISKLKAFYEQSKDFWQNTNQNIRRYTKKVLDSKWIIDSNKTEENLQNFLEVYYATAKRQKFSIHLEDYYYKLFDQDFSRLIIVKDQDGRPQTVWFGIQTENTLTYLFGGNSIESFAHKGQYMTHLVAINYAVSQDLRFYDLGGYEAKYSFSDFKRGYRGEVREFPGPADIVFKPSKYTVITNLIKLKNIFRK